MELVIERGDIGSLLSWKGAYTFPSAGWMVSPKISIIRVQACLENGAFEIKVFVF